MSTILNQYGEMLARLSQDEIIDLVTNQRNLDEIYTDEMNILTGYYLASTDQERSSIKTELDKMEIGNLLEFIGENYPTLFDNIESIAKTYEVALWLDTQLARAKLVPYALEEMLVNIEH